MKIKNLITGICAAALLTACGDDSSDKLSNNGEACELNEDCASGECWEALHGCFGFLGCATYALPGGMCSLECEWEEDSLSQEERTQGTCDDGEWCLIYGDSPKICFQDCLPDYTCAREDYKCSVIDINNDIFACLPPRDAAREVEDSRTVTTYGQSVLIKQ